MKLGTDIVIMDDGFQHLALQRDINIVLMDYENLWVMATSFQEG